MGNSPSVALSTRRARAVAFEAEQVLTGHEDLWRRSRVPAVNALGSRTPGIQEEAAENIDEGLRAALAG